MTGTAAGGLSEAVTANIATRAYRPAAHPIVRIHLLGPMRATSYLGDDVLPRAKKARAALGYLCLAFGARVPRARLASMLWDRVDDAQARTSFRQAVKEMTSAMGSLSPELITTGRASIRFNTDACWIDALALLESSSSDSARTDLAVLCAGELLESLDEVSPCFGQWLAKERIRFKESLKGSLDTVLQQIDRPGFDAKQLAAVARRLISYDPTHQGASRALMRALAKLGQRDEALLEYERCRQTLMKAFHVKPSMESQRLYDTIRARSARTRRPRAPAEPRFHPAATDSPTPVPERSRLRVGVLSFDSDGSENDQDLALSLSHEVATALARFRWFDVISPVAMMQRPLATLLSKDAFERQQLDYVVDGTVTRTGPNYHISVRLLDLARCTRPVWSDRFGLAVRELHRLNELVTGRIVGSIDPVILFIEGRPKRRERYGATGLLFLAIPLIYSMERNKFQQAGQLIQRALAIEPDNSMAVTLLAYWHLWHVGQGWTTDSARTLSTVETLCLRAMELDPENSEAMGIYAYTLAWKREFDRAVQIFDRSLRLNPNLAYIWALSAAVYSYIGEPQNALSRLARYRDLAPLDPYYAFFENAFTIAYTFKHDYERAVVVGRRVVKANPEFINGYKPLIASLGHLGRRQEAAPYVQKLLSLEPDFTIAKFRKAYPFKLVEDRDNYCKGLLLAGIPKR
jgi:DNA-binding SARP family transcriptional activator/TolB-like protein/Flp pilus assembly protein TadD